MNSVSFDSFAENMDHEFRNVDLPINKVGYKVDGEGIKIHCQCRTLKSVDYFHDQNGDIVFIEFSDLAAQNEQIHATIEDVKKSGMQPNNIRQLIGEMHKKIPQEMRKKYIDSIHIMRCMGENITNIPEWASNRGKGKYYIVVAPISELAPETQKGDLVRMLDTLQNRLTESIPDPLFNGVEVIPLNRFIG